MVTKLLRRTLSFLSVLLISFYLTCTPVLADCNSPSNRIVVTQKYHNKLVSLVSFNLDQDSLQEARLHGYEDEDFYKTGHNYELAIVSNKDCEDAESKPSVFYLAGSDSVQIVNNEFLVRAFNKEFNEALQETNSWYEASSAFSIAVIDKLKPLKFSWINALIIISVPFLILINWLISK